MTETEEGLTCFSGEGCWRWEEKEENKNETTCARWFPTVWMDIVVHLVMLHRVVMAKKRCLLGESDNRWNE